MLRSHLVLLPSLGGVPSCRSSIRRPSISTGDTYTYKSWAISTYTRNGPHDIPNTEGQGARVRSNMKLWTTMYSFTSYCPFCPPTILVLWQLLDLSSFMYFLPSDRRPLMATMGSRTYSDASRHQLLLCCPGVMDMDTAEVISRDEASQLQKPLTGLPKDHFQTITRTVPFRRDVSYCPCLSSSSGLMCC